MHDGFHPAVENVEVGGHSHGIAVLAHGEGNALILGEADELFACGHVEVAGVHLGLGIVECIVDGGAQCCIVRTGHIAPGRITRRVCLSRDMGRE